MILISQKYSISIHNSKMRDKIKKQGFLSEKSHLSKIFMRMMNCIIESKRKEFKKNKDKKDKDSLSKDKLKSGPKSL